MTSGDVLTRQPAEFAGLGEFTLEQQFALTGLAGQFGPETEVSEAAVEAAAAVVPGSKRKPAFNSGTGAETDTITNIAELAGFDALDLGDGISTGAGSYVDGAALLAAADVIPPVGDASEQMFSTGVPVHAQGQLASPAFQSGS